MLLEFQVMNFRSVRERVGLSMVNMFKADSDDQRLTVRDLRGLGEVGLLSSAAIYGANASGKSNLIRAIGLFRHLVVNSATELKPGEDLDLVPFRLDKSSRSEPTVFEVTFLVDGVRYQYGIAGRRNKIEGEWMFAYPYGRPRIVFNRYLDDSGETYSFQFGSHYKIDQDLKNRVRMNSLFLSVAAQFNDRVLSPIYNWFANKFAVIDLSGQGFGFPHTFTARRMLENDSVRERIVGYLRHADMGIDDVTVEERSYGIEDLPQEIRDHLASQDTSTESFSLSTMDVSVVHRQSSSDESVIFDFDDESAGTQRFFSLLGPLVDMLDRGMCVAIDELDTSLHPLLTRRIVELIHSKRENPHGAQLIYTTHDTTLLDSDLQRRDQVWFTEKSSSGNSQLVRLSEYKPRKYEAFEKGYLAGRYGGIPFFTGDLSK